MLPSTSMALLWGTCHDIVPILGYMVPCEAFYGVAGVIIPIDLQAPYMAYTDDIGHALDKRTATHVL